MWAITAWPWGELLRWWLIALIVLGVLKIALSGSGRETLAALLVGGLFVLIVWSWGRGGERVACVHGCTQRNCLSSVWMAAGGKVIGAMEGLDAQALLQLLGIYEAALAELRAMNDPGVEPLMRRLERNRAEALAALAALWFPEGQTPWAGLRACGALVSPGIKEIE